MKSTIVVACLVAAIALANLASIGAVAIAWRKDKTTFSKKGVIFGVTGLLVALGLSAAIDWEFVDNGKYGLAIAAPLLIGPIGIAMCLWKKAPDQTPGPMAPSDRGSS